MPDGINREPMLEMFIFETVQLVEQLEQEVLSSERENGFSESAINQIFRIMHTLKSSAAMMLFKNISSLAHAAEDLFYFIREQKPDYIDHSGLTDLILECIDYIKNEMNEIENGKRTDSDASVLLQQVKDFLELLKTENPSSRQQTDTRQQGNSRQKYYIAAEHSATGELTYYKAVVFFEAGCEMENVRAFTIAHTLKDMAKDIQYWPEDIIANPATAELIRQDGFTLIFASGEDRETLHAFFMKVPLLDRLELEEWQGPAGQQEEKRKRPPAQIFLDENEGEPVADAVKAVKSTAAAAGSHSVISVNVGKLDKLMDLVGELVITEAMVTQHPELAGLELDNFYKSARQLQKLTGELQDIVMSIRMVPLASTFQKMNRIVRDACKTLHKEVDLVILGEDTEVDKNIIEHIADPLMHLIRNSLDHGIETGRERLAAGKPNRGTITLEAKNSGGEVWILVKDDGRGLNREKIINKAREHGLTSKADHELTDKEVYSFIFLPGFSTKEAVTELSGRGVGMDVVMQNIEKIGGMIQVDSGVGKGTTISIKIPLTLAIVDGMNIRVGRSRYTVPITSIRQSFRARENEVILDPDGNELIVIRGVCYPVLRLHEMYHVRTKVTDICQGITILVEQNGKGACLFADELLGQQQVVIKALPRYIKKIQGLAGCALLGDGHISLILDMDGVLQAHVQ
ncbi:hypothetical protein P22_1795 [Propionispora sp. 2/2-37]|uniref:chemotaxis protein CheA n=1 Tax=Propionispora sp. 2/2-37 TaxID=1677858 RepID=UPI0006BB7225|nr:chemotaxis protein CheA [Propionispora sp. 2/2-37]CUH95717.1 hypothetical protein P22_1795 [Propionispora sp. 2/2-37]